tara:strand:- start:81591 stop:82175 length:585 start_codon:yes stop_codon:yes gene_type:complete
MGKYNIKSIRRKVVRSRKFSQAAQQRVVQNLNKAKRQIVSEFDNHPITRELEQGDGGGNISKTLGGYGNLFTFIGFNQGSDPVAAVRTLLLTIPQIRNQKTTGNRISFVVSVPQIEDFRAVAKMPWEGGRSWVEGVESGISGFGYYMANLFGKNIKSRSGSAIQSKNKVRTSSYRPMPYMTPMLNKFMTIALRG